MNVWLRFLSGSRQGETIPFALPPGGVIAIGSADDNHVVLPPPIESHHAALRNENGALLIQALGRTRNGGIFRAAQKVERAPVLSSDQFELGRGGPVVEVLFQIEAAPPPPPPPARSAPLCAPSFQQSFQMTAPQRPVADFQMTAPQRPVADFAGTAASMPAFGSGSPAHAANGCPVCGAALGSDSFICYQCRRMQCTTHYDARAGICAQCAASRGAAPPPQFTAPSFPAIARTQEVQQVSLDDMNETMPVRKPGRK